jgi:outer membrane immunogenic protein
METLEMRFRLVGLIVGALGFGQVAHAADLPARSVYKAPPAAQAFSWTGCYIGGNVGGIRSETDWSLVAGGGSGGSHDADGLMAGGQAGCDYQVGTWVFGAEGMFNWTNADGSHVSPAGTRLSNEANWLALATARIGYAWDRNLFYVKGGGAWLDQSHTSVTAPGVATATGDYTRSGWTVGAGWEYAVAPSWSVKLEYNYMDFGSEQPSFCTAAGACAAPVNVEQDAHTVLIGVNWRFTSWR